MQCPRCSARTGLRRLKREGLLERALWPLFGRYPWECSSCRVRFLLRSRELDDHDMPATDQRTPPALR